MIKKCFAELFGTFCLVFFGCGTAMLLGCDSFSSSGYLLTAAAFGLVVVAMAYSIGNISGCHINPAVSVGMFVAGKLSFLDMLGYIFSQAIGGIAPDEFDENENLIPGYVTSVPSAYSISDSDKAARKLRNCKFKARIAGAIHFVEIKGSFTYEM